MMRAPSELRGESADCITLAGAAAAVARIAVPIGLATATMAAAQFTSGVNAVEVYASVTNAQGVAIAGLTQADFEVRENGEVQQITTFAAGDVPLAVALAIDRSFSMSGARLVEAKSAARAFLDELRPADEAMILAVGSRVDVAAPLSTDRAGQRRAVDRLDSFGTTGLHDAIIRAIDDVQPARGRRALVLLSDGNDRYSAASAADALEAARRSDVMIFPVATGAARPPLFAELATLTGGRSSHSPDGAALADTLRAIARELRQQYLLGYTPARPPVAGSRQWRSITVTVRKLEAHVRARDGYLVK